LKKLNYLFVLSVVFTFFSCDYFKKPEEQVGIARVNNSYLYEEDLEGLIPLDTSEADSIALVQDFINRWASQRLLIDAAERNLTEVERVSFEKLVKQYRHDLYTRAYLEAIVNRTIDTLISKEELQDYYKLHQSNFKTVNQIVKLRYINLIEDHPKFKVIQQKFFDDKTNPSFWESYQLQFKNFAMNDSIWVEMNQIYRKLPFITPENRDNYITKGNTIIQKDSLDVYLVKIKNVIDKNQEAPYEYIEPTLRQVILNQRKLELIRKFESDLTNDALKNNTYEIYN
jgi:hypothetical protein